MKHVAVAVVLAVASAPALSDNTTVGTGASATGNDLTTGLPVDGVTAVGFGSQAVNSTEATLVGSSTSATDSNSATVVGARSAVVQSDAGTAVGTNINVVSSANATAVGSTVTIMSSPEASALGSNVTVSNSQNGVALGSQSFVVNSPYSASILGGVDNSTGGFAAGYNSAVSTSNYSLAIGRGAQALGTDGWTPGANSDPTKFVGNISIGNQAFTGYGVSSATAIGMWANVFGPWSDPTIWSGTPITGGTSVGYASSVVGISPYSSAFGAWSSVNNASYSTALGAYTSVTGNNSVALGAYSTTSATNTVSIGNATLQRTLTGVAAGTSTYDAVNYGQFSALQTQVSNLSSGGGGGGGGNVVANSSTMSYSDGNAAHDASVTVTSGQVTISAGDPNTVTVSATGIAIQTEAGSATTIQNAAGKGITVSDSGVAVNTNVDMQGNRIQNVGDAVSAGDAVNLRTLQSALAPMDQRISNVESRVTSLEGRVDKVERIAAGGVATALAMAQPVAMSTGQRNAITMGVGTYYGQSAIGASYNRLVVEDSRKTIMVSAGAGVSTASRPAARAGFSLSW